MVGNHHVLSVHEITPDHGHVAGIGDLDVLRPATRRGESLGRVLRLPGRADLVGDTPQEAVRAALWGPGEPYASKMAAGMDERQ